MTPDEAPELVVTESRPRPGVRVLRPVGVVDLRTAPLLGSSVREHAADHSDRLVLDLAGVRLLAAAGVALVVTVQRELRDRLLVTGVRGNPAVERVLELTGTRDRLEIHDDLDAVLDRLDPG